MLPEAAGSQGPNAETHERAATHSSAMFAALEPPQPCPKHSAALPHCSQDTMQVLHNNSHAGRSSHPFLCCIASQVQLWTVHAVSGGVCSAVAGT